MDVVFEVRIDVKVFHLVAVAVVLYVVLIVVGLTMVVL